MPAFPLWSAFQAPIYSHPFFARLARAAVPETDKAPDTELETERLVR